MITIEPLYGGDVAEVRSDGHALRVMTWNLRGSARPDLALVAKVVREQAPDVLALQEVRERQARSLAAALGGVEWRWHAKHRPPFLPGPLGRRWTEGLAVLTRLPLLAVDVATVSDGAPLRSYRRRIAQDVVIAVGEGAAAVGEVAAAVRVVNTHLASDDADSRAQQTARVLELVAAITDEPRVALERTVVVGDLNTPDEPGVIGALVAAGFAETWPQVGVGEGWTNPAHAPAQRLDHVLVGAGLTPVAATVLATPETRDARRASDHLPLLVDLHLPLAPRRSPSHA